MKKHKILFVCSGNTCRSPLAAYYLKKLLSEKKINNYIVLSAGTSAISGAPASENARKIANSFGFSLEQHRSRPLTLDLIKSASLVIGMTQSHINTAIHLSNEKTPSKFKTLLSFTNKNGNNDISDPFGGDEQTYLSCFLEIKQAVEALTEKLPIIIKELQKHE